MRTRNLGKKRNRDREEKTEKKSGEEDEASQDILSLVLGDDKISTAFWKENSKDDEGISWVTTIDPLLYDDLSNALPSDGIGPEIAESIKQIEAWNKEQ